MAMSARRDRPPSGRHNARENKEFYQQDLSGKSSSRPQSARVRNPSPRQNENLETRRMNRPVSASQSPTNTHGVGFKSNHFSSSSDRFPQCLDSPHIDSVKIHHTSCNDS